MLLTAGMAIAVNLMMANNWWQCDAVSAAIKQTGLRYQA